MFLEVFGNVLEIGEGFGIVDGFLRNRRRKGFVWQKT